MTVYSDNLRIPHLDSDVFQPYIPENTAKDIIDSFLTKTYTITTTDPTADITIEHSDSPLAADDWQSFIFDVVEGIQLTAPINVFLPDYPRPYIFQNNCSQSITFSTVAGSGFSIPTNENAYGYCDGTDIVRLNFAADGAGASFESLNDTPGSGEMLANPLKNVTVNSSGDSLEYTDAPVIWTGIWADGITYKLNDMVRDGGYLGIVVEPLGTEERLAPQEVGGLQDGFPVVADFTINSSDTVITMKHTYTFLQGGFVREINIILPVVTVDTIIRVTITNLASGETTVAAPIITPEVWYSLAIGSIAMSIGAQYEVKVELYTSDSSTTFNNVWESDVGVGDPTDGVFSIDDVSTPSSIKIDNVATNSINYRSNLDDYDTDSILHIVEEGDSSRSVTVKIDAMDDTDPDYIQYDVTVLDNGPKNLRNGKTSTLTFQQPTSTSDYAKIDNYYAANEPDFADITTELLLDGVAQAPTTTAYGIDIVFQQASISDDYIYLAVSDSSASSSNLLSGKTFQNYGEVLNELGDVSGNPVDIDIKYGNVVSATIIGDTTFTFTTDHDNTSFTLLITDGDVYTMTWPTISWDNNIEPTWTSTSLATITKIGSIWIGGALTGIVT